MVIANRFITQTTAEAFGRVCSLNKDREVKAVPLPTIATMTYWLSDDGRIYGCQQMRNMCVTKPVKVDSRYKKGCSMRYSIGEGNQKQAFMQNIMYSTFVTNTWDGDMEFTFKDGNPYNYQLTNIEPKKPEIVPVLKPNLEALQQVYASHHSDVSWYIRKFFDIPLDDCKDIASDVFFYLCGFRSYTPDHFVGIWKQTAVHRAQDWWKHRSFADASLYWEESGEERFGKPDREVEVADIWGCVRGEKRKQYLRLWSEGETYAEIAERTDSTPGTVSGEVCRGLKELRMFFEKDIAV